MSQNPIANDSVACKFSSLQNFYQKARASRNSFRLMKGALALP